jgi:FkbM family methyltransferase
MTLIKPVPLLKHQSEDANMKHLVGKVKSIVKEYAPWSVTGYHLLRNALPRTEDNELWPGLLHKLNATTSDIFFVEIGAMDGVSFDPLYEYVVANHWRGLLVEPLHDMFDQLRKAYQNQKGLIFENVAIAEAPGTKKIYRVSLDSVEQGLVPYWAKGISSFFDDRNEIGGMGVSNELFKTIQSHVTSEIVRCETLHNLLYKHDIRKIDVLQIDVEGYDYEILKQLDFGRFRPRIIRMEWSVLTRDERQQTLELFKVHGYRTRILSEDIIAWRGLGLLSRFTKWN